MKYNEIFVFVDFLKTPLQVRLLDRFSHVHGPNDAESRNGVPLFWGLVDIIIIIIIIIIYKFV